eukprot:CAMPEP_0177781314 /NCGR_PEP_ID=MMETSP0491_2-20121128/17766_1 /TAXON_ID=63592 /ORGANISM="Tetraselmis chuii, Strain PLY429" /LENGTH=46 /DNA_ID= /DNA_START= /DNA_END= /DNA_ORIENTATION=
MSVRRRLPTADTERGSSGEADMGTPRPRGHRFEGLAEAQAAARSHP